MISVVIDTSVVVSAALRPTSVPAAVVAAALGDLLDWYVSEPILAEYDEVLKRDKFPLSSRWVDEFLGEIRSTATLVQPKRTLTQAKDEPDNRFLECAETAQADFLITGNTRHFPHRWAETIILTPRAFIDLWRKEVQSP